MTSPQPTTFAHLIDIDAATGRFNLEASQRDFGEIGETAKALVNEAEQLGIPLAVGDTAYPGAFNDAGVRDIPHQTRAEALAAMDQSPAEPGSGYRPVPGPGNSGP